MGRSAFVAPVLALALAACGGGGGPGSSVDYGHGDTARFVIDGRTISVTESGRASVDVPAAPEVRHYGPVGCAGRYFTAEFVPDVHMFFRYGSQDAYLLVGSDLYYLGEPPERTGGSLSWNTTSGGHQIQIRADCPPPPKTGPLTAARTPAACSVLTPALAQQAVRRPVSAPKFVQENPDLSYCAYATRNKSFGGSRRASVSVGSADVIEQLISWQAPRISGLGDEAHGADASDGLAVRQGKLGLEVTVDLGESAGNAQNLAAEEALARRLLARLPG